MIKGVILAVFCSAIALVLHIGLSFFRHGRQENEPLIFELIRQMKLLASICFLAFIIYILLFIFQPVLISDSIKVPSRVIFLLNFIYGAGFYLTLSFSYLTFYYLINRSVSATILEYIDDSLGNQMTADEIKKIYGIENKYLSELRGMLEGGFIIKQGDYYRNSFKGKIFAIIAKLMKRYLKLGPGG